METILGTLFRGGTEVVKGLEISLNTMRAHAEREEWHGSFRLPPDSRLERGEYTLRLVDGRTGSIQVVFTSVFCDRTLSAQFTGTSSCVPPIHELAPRIG
ncbi:MAG: hypothetical protein IH608_02055 [Proteobacteria bacterium]|nr:hypothetical protein [Pseudomonadota bacterium]